MTDIIRANVRPEMIQWAREYARYTLQSAADVLRISIEKLSFWENGEISPTINQLHKLAQIYNIPFAFFFYSSPPISKELPIKDFRRLPGDGFSIITPELASEVRTSLGRREIIIELAHELNEPIAEFNLSFSFSDDPIEVSKLIRHELGITVDKQKSWRKGKGNEAFNQWRELFERNGILVFQSSELSLDLLRGFSIENSPLPIIVLNRKDSYYGRIFTLMHELSHIMLRASGICDMEADESLPPEIQKLEIFCNELAANILMPHEIFLEAFNEYSLKTQDEFISDYMISKISKDFTVSQEAALRRMVTLGLISKEFYSAKREKYLYYYSKRSSSGFVPPATNAISLGGKQFANLILGAYEANKITGSDASTYLGVKTKHFAEIAFKVGV